MLILILQTPLRKLTLADNISISMCCETTVMYWNYTLRIAKSKFNVDYS